MHKAKQTPGLMSPVFFALPKRTAQHLAALLLSLVSVAATAQSMLLPTAQLVLQGEQVQAEIAATEDSRSYGLMNRTSLLANHGMIFVFDEPGIVCFWMKNTILPLSIAFIDDKGVISNITDMQPQTLDTHCPTRAIRYALEMEQGWFTARQIKPGTVVENLPSP